MSPKSWLTIFGWSLLALGAEIFFGFGFAFSPGWAEGWPFGLSIYSVWSAGMSFVFFLVLMTASVGIGAMTGAACSNYGVGLRCGRVVYAGWLMYSCFMALWVALWAFREIFASSLLMWPTGYNP